MSNQKRKPIESIEIERKFIDPFGSRSREIAEIELLMSNARKVKNRNFNFISIEDDLKSASSTSRYKADLVNYLFYAADPAKDIKKSNDDYMLWIYLSELLLRGIKKAKTSFIASGCSNSLIDLSKLEYIYLSYTSSVKEKTPYLTIGLSAPIEILHRYDLPLKCDVLESGECQILDDERGEILDLFPIQKVIFVMT